MKKVHSAKKRGAAEAIKRGSKKKEETAAEEVRGADYRE